MDFLVSADMLIPHVAEGVQMCTELLGFEPPSQAWYGRGPGRGYTVVFLRAQRSLKAAPTRIEIMAPDTLSPELPPSRTLPHMPGLWEAQRHLQTKTHGTVFATSRMPEVLQRMTDTGARHWLDPASPEWPFPRLWIGVSEENKDEWIPGDDGGLLIEVVESASVPGIAESAGAADPTDWDTLAPGDMVRVRARRWIVPSAAESRANLKRTLDLELSEPAPTVDGRVFTRLRPRHPRSATVDLIEGGGPAPSTIVIEVNDLDAKAAELTARGARFTRRPDEVDGDDSLVIDVEQTLGVPFAFVEVGR